MDEQNKKITDLVEEIKLLEKEYGANIKIVTGKMISKKNYQCDDLRMFYK